MKFAVYYRDSDSHVIGVNPCVDNFDISEAATRFGGTGISGLKLDTYSAPTRGKKYKVENGALVEIDDPLYQAQNSDRDSGLARIKLTCGLTDREMKAVFGG